MQEEAQFFFSPCDVFFSSPPQNPPFSFLKKNRSQSLTCLELWQMIKQHYGNDLGMSHEEMESLQISAESSVHAR